jgi:hypothetical protein
VKTYTVYVHDARYAAPTLLLVEMGDDELVRAYASERLGQSSDYLAVEIWDNDRLVGRLERAPEA